MPGSWSTSKVFAASSIEDYRGPKLAEAVRGLLEETGALDAARGARRIVLKPNWVHHRNPLGFNSQSLVTHTAVVEAVAQAVCEQLSGRASLIIGDSPVQSCDFAELLDVNGVHEAVRRLEARYPQVAIEVRDWRLVKSTPRNSLYAVQRIEVAPDMASHVLVDLGDRSFLEPVSRKSNRFRVTGYPPGPMHERHRPGVHQYLIARDVVDADLVINLPKLKTHIKAGITGSLKNLVGINGHKEFLPHHVTGSPENGGDSNARRSGIRELFERYYDFHFENLASLPRPFISLLSRGLTTGERITSRVYGVGDFGSWSGNDTVWRMTLDLNHLLYAWGPKCPEVFTLMDAIVVGTGDGPLRPQPAALGVILAGRNPACVDFIAARLLDFDPRSLPTIQESLTNQMSIFCVDEPRIEALPIIHAKRPRKWESNPRAPVQ